MLSYSAKNTGRVQWKLFGKAVCITNIPGTGSLVMPK